MDWVRRLLHGLYPLHPRRRRHLEAEIADELRFHLEMRIRDSVAAGMTPGDARSDALLRFGDVGDITAQCLRVQEVQLRVTLGLFFRRRVGAGRRAGERQNHARAFRRVRVEGGLAGAFEIRHGTRGFAGSSQVCSDRCIVRVGRCKQQLGKPTVRSASALG